MIDEAGSDCELVDLEVPEITETEKEMENQRLAIKQTGAFIRELKDRLEPVLNN
ncbi:13019_t:CDS:2 [Rhizophagus irregularis]|nr:13019_t:CDS:2 [Rhizophagus irregularis]